MPVIITGKSPYDRSGELLSQGFAQGFGMAMEAGRLSLVKEQQKQREEAARQRQQLLGSLQQATGEDDVVMAYLQAQGNPSGAAMYAGLEEGPEKRQLRRTFLEQAQAEKDAEELQGTLTRFQAAEQAGILPPGSAQLAVQGAQTGGVTRGELEDELYNAQRRFGQTQAKMQSFQAQLADLDEEIAKKAPKDAEVLTDRAVIQAMLEGDPQLQNEYAINQAVVKLKRKLVDPEVEEEILRERVMDPNGPGGLNESSKLDEVLGVGAFREPTPEAERALPTDEMPGEFMPAAEDKSEPRAETKVRDRASMAKLRERLLSLPKMGDEEFKREVRKAARELGLRGKPEDLIDAILAMQGESDEATDAIMSGGLQGSEQRALGLPPFFNMPKEKKR